MAVIMDNTVVVVMATGDSRRSLAQAPMRDRIDAGEGIHAPELLPYEVANALTRLVAAGAFSLERLPATW